MSLSTLIGLLFIPATFAVVEYLSHRFVKGGKNTTMDSKNLNPVDVDKGSGGGLQPPAVGDLA
jgi:HAE1 family hydrophobic/amphiphilic exporter-1